MNIYDFLYPNFKFDKKKPIRLFEAFAGIGTQSLALKYLGIDFEHVGISEVDKHALKAHQAIHGYVENMGGIGSFEQLPPNIDICTWSFPCQDVSIAGTQSGLSSGTQSNYGYIFLDTVESMRYEDRPQVLLMENVEALTGSVFEKDYQEIHLRLERMGYQSYGQVLQADNYGIPQKRRRIFVVSIKGEYNYIFPTPKYEELTILDYLESGDLSEYFMKDETVKSYLVEMVGKYPRRKRFLRNINREDTHIANTFTTRQGGTPIDNYIKYNKGVLDLNVEATYENLTSKEVTIRKLTPLESWRLMGIKDEDFYKAKNAGISDSQLYKQAGNAIVVDVLMAIFKEILRSEL